MSSAIKPLIVSTPFTSSKLTVMPAATMRANRLWFASMAYVLMGALRRIALAGTELACTTRGSIRLKLLEIGAEVTISVRRVKIVLASS